MDRFMKGDERMNFTVERKAGVPIYVQIKEQIKNFIAEGLLQSGDKLPTERELAQSISTSRNTISQAYKELGREGVLCSLQGKGTFVAEGALAIDGHPSPEQESLRNKLIGVIDRAIDEAAEMGFGLDEFLAMVHVRTMAKKEMQSIIRVGFIECHQEQLEYFERKVDLGMNVQLMPILLDDFLKGSPKYIETISKLDVLTTSTTHLGEVESRLKDKKALGIALQLEADTIVRIAKLPPQAKISLICHTNNYSARVKQALAKVGLTHFEWEVYTGPLTEKNLDKIQTSSLILTCISRKAEVQKILQNKVEILEFSFLPDAGSLNMIRSAVKRVKDKRS